MPKFPTFPVLLNECKTLRISDFKKWGCFKADKCSSGNITFSKRDTKTGSISYSLCLFHEDWFLELRYFLNKVSFEYRISLIQVPSNLGKGFQWLFVCPKTGKRCRKLYLVDTYFYHRTAFSNCMYEKQTYSHKFRNTGKLYDSYFGSENAYEQIYKKHFKKTYKGKMTKKYLKLSQQIQRSEGISHLEIERMMII